MKADISSAFRRIPLCREQRYDGPVRHTYVYCVFLITQVGCRSSIQACESHLGRTPLCDALWCIGQRGGLAPHRRFDLQDLAEASTCPTAALCGRLFRSRRLGDHGALPRSGCKIVQMHPWMRRSCRRQAGMWCYTWDPWNPSTFFAHDLGRLHCSSSLCVRRSCLTTMASISPW